MDKFSNKSLHNLQFSTRRLENVVHISKTLNPTFAKTKNQEVQKVDDEIFL